MLDNGLVRRVIRTQNGCGTIAVDDLMTGRSLLRAVRPEGWVTIDGRQHAIGGLVGQPNQAFLTPAWLAGLAADPEALELTACEPVPVRERLEWKRVRHAAPGAVWPPRGVAWYKAHRDILESDLIHLRRADGLDWDGMLHVNPALEERALLAVFNPTAATLDREIVVPLHYAGLVVGCRASVAGGPDVPLALDAWRRARITVTIPPGGHQWVVFRAP